jgi:hypothetical protein
MKSFGDDGRVRVFGFGLRPTFDAEFGEGRFAVMIE